MSSAIEPEGTTSTATCADSSPSFMIAPLPNCFSICCKARSSALDFSLADGVLGIMSASPSQGLPIVCGGTGPGGVPAPADDSGGRPPSSSRNAYYTFGQWEGRGLLRPQIAPLQRR